MSGSVSPLPWTGNKGCIYTTIDAFMPPHRTYVEACMGSAEVFLRKKPVEKEIINDYNGDLVRFFRVLQRNENLERLIGRLFLSFNSEQIFRANKALLAEVPNILDDLTETSVIIENTQWNDFDLAVAFYENQVFSFSSTGKNFAITKKDMTKRFGRLIAACARLRNATIMHRDYKDCISYGAGEDAFILLDPPYKGTEDYYQKSSFGSDEHAKLFGFTWNAKKIQNRAARLSAEVLKLFPIVPPDNQISFADSRYQRYTAEDSSNATFKVVNYYELLGERVKVDSFAGMVRSVARKLYELDSTIIEEMAKKNEAFYSWVNPAFSYDEKAVKGGKRLLKDNSIYISTGFSAYDCISFIRSLLRKYDLDISEDFVYSAMPSNLVNKEGE